MANDTIITGDKPVAKSHAGTMLPDPVPEQSTNATRRGAVRIPPTPATIAPVAQQRRRQTLKERKDKASTRGNTFVVLPPKNPKAAFAVSQSELEELAVSKILSLRYMREAQRIEERVAQALLAGGKVQPGPRVAELVVEREGQPDGSGIIVKLFLT